MVSGGEEAAGIIDLGANALTGISPDELQVVSWCPGESGTVKVWSARRGIVYYSVSLPSDSELLWIGYLGQSENPSAISGRGELLKIESGVAPVVVPLEGGALKGGMFAVSSDGKTIAYGGDGAKVWDAVSGKLLASTAEGQPFFVSFTESGDRAAFLSEGTVAVWSRDRGTIAELSTTFPHAVSSGVRSTTGRYLAAPSRERIEIIDVESERTEYVDVTEDAQAYFGLKDTELAVVHGKERKHQVDIWNLGKGLDDLTFRRTFLSSNENVVTYSEGEVLCCNPGSDAGLVLHKVATGTSQTLIGNCRFFDRLPSWEDPAITAMKFFAQNSRAAIASGTGVVGLWNLRSQQVKIVDGYNRKQNTVEKPTTIATCLGAVALPDSVNELKIAGSTGSLIAECSNGQVYLLVGEICFPKVQTLSVAFSTGVEGNYDGTMVDFSPNGELISVTASRSVFVMNTNSGAVVRSIKGDFFLGKFDDTGEKLFLLGSSSHGLGDLKSGQFVPMSEFGAPTRQLTGKKLMTGFYTKGQHGTRTIAEANTGKVVNTIRFESLLDSNVRLSDDGKTIAGVGRRKDSSAGIELVDVVSGKSMISMNIEGGFGSYCKALAGGRLVAVSSERGMSFYDVRRRRLKSVIPASKYWLNSHLDSGVKYVGVDVRRGRNEPTTDQEELNGMVELQKKEFRAVKLDICESKSLCLIAEAGRVSLWQYETGELLWLGYAPAETPVQALLTGDGTKAAVMTNRLLQVIDITPIVATASGSGE